MNLKILQTFFEINNYENIEELLKIGEFIENNLENGIITNDYKGIILDYYKKLINNEIDGEEFMSIGDISSNIKIQNNNNIEFLFEIYSQLIDEKLKNNLSNKIIIANNQSKIYFENYLKTNNIDYYELNNGLNLIHSSLFII